MQNPTSYSEIPEFHSSAAEARAACSFQHRGQRPQHCVCSSIRRPPARASISSRTVRSDSAPDSPIYDQTTWWIARKKEEKHVWKACGLAGGEISPAAVHACLCAWNQINGAWRRFNACYVTHDFTLWGIEQTSGEQPNSSLQHPDPWQSAWNGIGHLFPGRTYTCYRLLLHVEPRSL